MNLKDEIKLFNGVSGKLSKINEDGTIEFKGPAEGLCKTDIITWIAHKDMVTFINGENVRKVAGKDAGKEVTEGKKEGN